jgi:hypothetical protein
VKPASSPDPVIYFYYESDGGPAYIGNGITSHQPATHYIVAEHPDWSDPKRLDFADRKQALLVLTQLRRGKITAEQAAEIAQREWL